VIARVVVTDAEERAALGACRGLASAGYRVTAVARHRPAAAHWSRSCAKRILSPDPRESVAAFADRLDELLRSGWYAALIPGSDASLLAVSEHRSRLERLTRLGLPSREAVSRSVDKLLLLQVAAEAGLAPPPSRPCRDRDAAAGAANELGYPVVLKPARSFSPVGGGLRQQRVALATDGAALARALPQFQPPFIVQRFEQARFLSCTGVVANGRLLALTTSRVLRLWPPEAGMHTLSETVAIPPGLAGRVRALLTALEWQGIFQLQMLELADGRLAVIDLNPRIFASITLDAHAGANLAAVWCDWLLGRNPAQVIARPGLRYRWEEGELCHLAWQLRHRRLRAAASVLLPHRRVAHAWFRLSDPAPLAARLLYLALRSIKNVVRRRPAASVQGAWRGSPNVTPPVGARGTAPRA
jgi:predicted ATP-grasp superfamily ATP-dependent carboligase